MVHYKLTYFYGRGLCELTRQIFILAGQEFEDVRIQFAEWPALKEKTPFGQLPVLEEDGKELPQSAAISRYLARKFGFAGKTAWEEAQADALIDQISDFRKEVQKFMSAASGFIKENLEDLKKEVLIPAVEKHLPFFVNALEKSGSGFIVGDSVTWADLAVAEFVALLFDRAPETLDAFPDLKTHMQKIHSIPQIKAWIEKRPITNF